MGDICQEFICPICTDVFVNPKGLPCLHSFCRDCLQTFLTNQEKQVLRRGFTCPVCRLHIFLPNSAKPLSEWADQFPTNHHLSNIMEFAMPKVKVVNCRLCACRGQTQRAVRMCTVCRENYCNDCANLHNLLKATKNHKLKKISAIESDLPDKRSRTADGKVQNKSSSYEISVSNGLSHSIVSETDDESCYVTGAIFLDDDKVVLCDSANRKIKLVSAEAKILYEEENFSPYDVTKLTPEELAISNRENVHFLKVKRNVLSMKKTYSTDWKIYIPKTLKISQTCRGICYCNGNFIVCCGDDDNKHVTIKDKNGEFTRQIWQDNSGSRLFLDPWYCAVDPMTEDIFISDSFQQHGQIISLSKRGVVRWIRTLAMPRGICVLGEHLFVADMKDDSIKIFTLHGDFVKTVLSRDDDIRRPQVVAINNTSDKLLVVMAPPYHNDCIKIFDLNYRKKDTMQKCDTQSQKGKSCFVS